MYPWVCTAPGCQQTKLWSLYTQCKDCNAVRLTPPLAQQPDTQEPLDREAKYEAPGAQTPKEKPTDRQKEPTILQEKTKETEQGYANVQAAETRWLNDRLQRFAETQKNVKDELPEDPAKTLMEGVEAGGPGEQKNEAADPAGQVAKGAAAASAGV